MAESGCSSINQTTNRFPKNFGATSRIKHTKKGGKKKSFAPVRERGAGVHEMWFRLTTRSKKILASGTVVVLFHHDN